MAYNKAREERKWRLWKEAEEKQLRNLGVSVGDIEKLRVHDWAVINNPGASTQALCSAPTSPLTALAFCTCFRKRKSGVC